MPISYGNAFLADDNILPIVNNRLLHGLGAKLAGFLTPKRWRRAAPISGRCRALLNLIVYQIARRSLSLARLSDLPNVVVACGQCTGLVYALGRKLAFAPLPVFLAALLWALHPIQTEAVTQISGVADVLYSFFCLLGVIVLFPDFSRRRMWLAVPLMAAWAC